MSDLKRLEEALILADEAGNTEDARILAEEISLMVEGGVSPEPQEELSEEAKMGFLNKVIAQTAGAPVDITNALLQKVGLGSEEPFGGSESIRRGMAAIGAPTPERDPATMGEKMFAGAGEAAGFMLPAAALARRYQAAQGMGGQLARSFNQQLVDKPTRAALAELSAGAGAGAGRAIAEQNELGPTGTFAAEMVGGMAPGALAYSPTLKLAKMGKKGAQSLGAKAFIPFTKEGAKARAARRLQDLTPDEAEALRSIDEYAGSGLSPAAATGQGGFLELEDAVLRGDPARARRMSTKTSEEIEKLERAILDENRLDKHAPQKLIELRKERTKSALSARIEIASDEASEALTNLGDISPEDATEVVRNRLTLALDDLKEEEGRLWSRIPKMTKAPVRNTLSKYKSLVKDLSSAEKGDIPPSAKKIIGRVAKRQSKGIKIKKTTIKELDGLYKKLGEEATIARSEGSFNKARIAEDLRESILDDILLSDGGIEIQETIKTAREFSRGLNEKFRSGPVGKILGYSREGGAKIEPSLAMEKTIGLGGQTGEIARRGIEKAVSGDPIALEGMQNYIKGMFLRNAMDEGMVNPSKAATFIRRHKELLDAFPELNNQLRAAKSTEDVRRRVVKRGDGFRTAIDKPSVSSASRILDNAVGDEMNKILRSDDPFFAAKNIKRTLAKDKTGRAMGGFKAGASAWLFNQAKGAGDVANGAKLLRLLKGDNEGRVFREIYTKSEYDRLLRTANVMKRFQEQQLTHREKIPVLADKPAWLLKVLANTVGARVGSQVSRGTGYGNIQIPGIFSRAFGDITQRLTADKAAQMLSDAIEDPKLFRVLLEYKPTSRGKSSIRKTREHEKTLRAWMVGPGARLLEGEEAPE